LSVCAGRSRPRTSKFSALLVPREHKLEHANVIGQLSDERLEAMIAELEEPIAAKAVGLDAKVIAHEEFPALPAPERKRANLILEAADTAIASHHSTAIERSGATGMLGRVDAAWASGACE
jgi:hypothetical protein